MTDAENVFEWVEKELSRINALDESKFTEQNAVRIDEKKNQLKKVLSFRKDGDSSSDFSEFAKESRQIYEETRHLSQEIGEETIWEPPKTSELPTAATVKNGEFRTDEFTPMFEITEYGRKECREDGEELVRRKDVEKLLEEVQQD